MAKILYEETDDMHYLTRKQICSRLSGYGLEEPNRETFSDDIKWLSEFGIDVIGDIDKEFNKVANELARLEVLEHKKKELKLFLEIERHNGRGERKLINEFQR
jgi:hypothetical protein